MSTTLSSIRRLISRTWSSIAGFLQIGLIALFLIATFLFTRPPSEEDVVGEIITQLPSAPSAQLVSVIRPLPTTATLRVKSTGSIVVRAYVSLSPQISGRAIHVSDSLRPGGAFAAGEELLRIDPSDFELGLSQAKADVASARATLKLRKAEGDAATENYALLNPNDQVPPLVARAPQIDQAKAQLDAALARQDVAELALTRTRFSLPFAGRVTESSVELGQLLSPAQIFGRAFATSAVEALVPISTRELAMIAPAVGRAAIITIDNVRHRAVVDRVAAELDGKTRFSVAYLEVTSEDAIPPCTFIDVEIEGAPIANTLMLPEATRQMDDTLWIVLDGHLKRMRPEVLATTATGLFVKAFDYGQGVVLGAVPGAREELVVSVTEIDGE